MREVHPKAMIAVQVESFSERNSGGGGDGVGAEAGVSKYRTHYPANWKEISLAIRRDGAKWVCEWCGALNGALISPVRKSRVVLTVAHLGVPYPDGRPGDKHDKSDCRPENLAALCQRCHLNFDRPDHLARAASTRERKRRERDAARGWVQLDLLEVGPC